MYRVHYFLHFLSSVLNQLFYLVVKQQGKRGVSPTSNKPVITSTLTDSAKPFVPQTKTELSKTSGDKKVSIRQAIETKKAVKRVSNGSTGKCVIFFLTSLLF